MRTLFLLALVAAPIPARAQSLPQQEPPLTAIQEVIRMQLNSRATEVPPPAVPGAEAEAMRQLPPLRDNNSPSRGQARQGNSVGQR